MCDTHKGKPVDFYWSKGNKFICIECLSEQEVNTSDTKRIDSAMVCEKAKELSQKLEQKEYALRNCKINLNKISDRKTFSTKEIVDYLSEAV